MLVSSDHCLERNFVVMIVNHVLVGGDVFFEDSQNEGNSHKDIRISPEFMLVSLK